jgi:DNA-binding NarL/FixJ family response regulator
MDPARARRPFLRVVGAPPDRPPGAVLPPPLDRLTARELEVLELMTHGLSNGGIAERLHLAPRTVETHVRAVLHKLEVDAHPGIHRRVQAVLVHREAMRQMPQNGRGR